MSIKANYNKNGVTYRIRIFLGRDKEGKQDTKTVTFTPPAGLTEKQGYKKAKEFANMLKDKIKKGEYYDDNITFKEYSHEFMKSRDVKETTLKTDKSKLNAINQAIGHIKLVNLKASALQKFYKNLKEKGVKQNSVLYKSENIKDYILSQESSLKSFGDKYNISYYIIKKACQNKPIKIEGAKQISNALNVTFDDVFTEYVSDDLLSSATIKAYHILISTILKNAKLERIIPYNVANEHMKAPRTEKTEAKFLNTKEIEQFINALEKEENIIIKTALYILMFTGLRRGELLGLHWEDIDFDSNYIHVSKNAQYLKGKGTVYTTPKTFNSNRKLPIPQKLRIILKEYKLYQDKQKLLLGNQYNRKNSVVITDSEGNAYNVQTPNDWLKRFTAKNNIKKITPHSLRHTFATMHISIGTDIKTIQGFTGHKDTSTLFDIYGHILYDNMEEATDKFETELFKNNIG